MTFRKKDVSNLCIYIYSMAQNEAANSQILNISNFSRCMCNYLWYPKETLFWILEIIILDIRKKRVFWIFIITILDIQNKWPFKINTSRIYAFIYILWCKTKHQILNISNFRCATICDIRIIIIIILDIKNK